MPRIYPQAILSHFDKLVEGMQMSTQAFYATLEDAIEARAVAGAVMERVAWPEGSLFSRRREYVQVTRDTMVFVISAFPIGGAMYVSWWLGVSERGLRAWLGNLPVIGWFIRPLVAPMTFFRLDTAFAFQHHMHAAVLGVIDGYAANKGVRRLTGNDRKPVLRDLWLP
jgi:hypothetical protein